MKADVKRPVGAGAEVPETARLRRKIWESLITQLRAYAAAASLNGEEFQVDTLSDAAWVRHRGNAVSLVFHPSDGRASWRTSAADGIEMRGEFQIAEDGTLRFNGKVKELDAAALDWIETLRTAERRTAEHGIAEPGAER